MNTLNDTLSVRNTKKKMLKEARARLPNSYQASKDWCKYQAVKRLRATNKGPRRLRKAAMHTSSNFFNETKIWLLMPFSMAQWQSQELLARELLPKFAVALHGAFFLLFILFDVWTGRALWVLSLLQE